MAKTTEQKPTAPVKSEETTKLSFPLALLRLSLGMARADLANDKKEGLNPSPELERIPQIEYAIRALESRSTHTLVPNELWAEIKRVLGEYANRENWDKEAGFPSPVRRVWTPHPINTQAGYEPAQLVLAIAKRE